MELAMKESMKVLGDASRPPRLLDVMVNEPVAHVHRLKGVRRKPSIVRERSTARLDPEDVVRAEQLWMTRQQLSPKVSRTSRETGRGLARVTRQAHVDPILRRHELLFG
jgi:hypothetical protein